jgi:CRP-like cAMP-binding protein
MRLARAGLDGVTEPVRRGSSIQDLMKRASSPSFAFPLSQQQLADALGLSLVHTSKTWSRLRREGLFALSGGRLTLLNPRLTARMAAAYEQITAPRPLI